MTDWIPTRAEGEKIMAAFTPRMGRRYANGRNTDHGPAAHKAVSVLSPYVRRRLVTEQELVATALATHGPEDAEKFVQEVIWRGYFKGWLERRPQVWDSYLTGLEADLTALDRDRRLRRDIDRAMNGRPGWSVSMPGLPSWWIQAICTTTRGCGSPRSGSLRWSCRGGWGRISFTGT